MHASVERGSDCEHNYYFYGKIKFSQTQTWQVACGMYEIIDVLVHQSTSIETAKLLLQTILESLL